MFDSILNPKVDGAETLGGPRFVKAESPDGPRFVEAESPEVHEHTAELRTRAQKQHDASATALSKLAGSGELPTLGGAAPTLVVSAKAEDLAEGRGFAHLEGIEEPVSLAVARHVACSGNVQRVVFGDEGRILSLGSPERVFNRHQRRAITLRDGGCVIPGCRVPASWCVFRYAPSALLNNRVVRGSIASAA